MKWMFEYALPWRQPWPLYAGFNFETCSVGFFRYAGGGWGIRLCLLSFTIGLKRMPAFDGSMNSMQAQQQRIA